MKPMTSWAALGVHCPTTRSEATVWLGAWDVVVSPEDPRANHDLTRVYISDSVFTVRAQ